MRVFKSWVAVVVLLVLVGVLHGCAGEEKSSDGRIAYDGNCTVLTCAEGLMCFPVYDICGVATNGVCSTAEGGLNFRCAYYLDSCLKADGSAACGNSDVGDTCKCRRVATNGVCSTEEGGMNLKCAIDDENCLNADGSAVCGDSDVGDACKCSRVATNGVCSTEEGGTNLKCASDDENCLKADGSAVCGDSDVGDACKCSRVATNGVCSTEEGRMISKCANDNENCLKADGSGVCGENDACKCSGVATNEVCSTEAGQPNLVCGNRDESCLMADRSAACGDSDGCICGRVVPDGDCSHGSCAEGLACVYVDRERRCRVATNGVCSTEEGGLNLRCAYYPDSCLKADGSAACGDSDVGDTCICSRVGYDGVCQYAVDYDNCAAGLECFAFRCKVPYNGDCNGTITCGFGLACSSADSKCRLAYGNHCRSYDRCTEGLTCRFNKCKLVDGQKCWPAESNLTEALQCENGACLRESNKQALCETKNDNCICGKDGYNGSCFDISTCGEGLACSSADFKCKVGYDSTCNDTMTCAKGLACSSADSKCKFAAAEICGWQSVTFLCADGSCICERDKCVCGTYDSVDLPYSRS